MNVYVKPTAEDGNTTVAIYLLSTKGNEHEGAALWGIGKKLVQALEENAKDEVYKAEVNVGLASKEFDLNAYFGGTGMLWYINYFLRA
jgi:hypothetical protein